MKRIKKFNENLESDYEFIEDIKQILMPLIDEGFGFKHKVDPDFNDSLILYDFTLSPGGGSKSYRVSSGEWVFSGETDSSKDLESLEYSSKWLRSIGDNISEILDRITDLNNTPKMKDLKSMFYMEVDKTYLHVDLKFSMLKSPKKPQIFP